MYFSQIPYSYGGNYPIAHATNMSRVQEGNNQEGTTILLRGIKREAELSELYRQLAHMATNQKHMTEILYAYESKKAQLNQLTHLYVQLTGTLPVYEQNSISLAGYREGLQKAYEAEEQSYQEYLRGYSSIHHPLIQNVFLWALSAEQENATRVRILKDEECHRVTDYGGKPFVVDINEATKQNNTFRSTLWTGSHLQVTLMSINVGENIGLENHPNLDQFLRVEEGQGIVKMGQRKEQLNFQKQISDDSAIMIPANTWHNLINTGNTPLKLYSIYAPPQHPFGTIQETKADAMAADQK